MTVRILALVTDGYGARGGIARYNRDLLGALAGTGAQILVLPRIGDATREALPAGVAQRPAILGRLRFALAALSEAWRSRPVDIVFCGHVFMAPLAILVGRLTGARCWLQAHGIDIWSDRRDSIRRAIESADMVTTVSRATRQRLLEWVDLAPERVRVLPNTVDDRFSPGPPPAALRDRLKVGTGPLLLTVGRLAASERYKGHELVFSALPALRARHPGLVYLVAGEGDDRARLERRAAELAGEADAVRFLGYVSDAELPDLYRLADLYVMPSAEEGFGVVYLEAAACGLRVVGGAGGGSRDAVPDERVGLLVDPRDRQALVEAVLAMLDRGRVDPAAIEPYRRPHFAATAGRLLAGLVARPRRMRDMP
ncbi:glycosyltransferase family 4 protein [Reyranella sp.]|uniref:glycosyltransferase family 4 protein n=1 Tax=Reyranella sp. TaxID=1929291 RepID=UPI003BAA69F6